MKQAARSEAIIKCFHTKQLYRTVVAVISSPSSQWDADVSEPKTHLRPASNVVGYDSTYEVTINVIYVYLYAVDDKVRMKAICYGDS